VMASALVTFGVADLVPIETRSTVMRWPTPRLVMAAFVAVVCIHSIVIPAAAFYYNSMGVRSYHRGALDDAERYQRQAIAIVQDHASFLENMSKVYIAEFERTRDPGMLDLAQQCLKTAIAGNPNAVEPYLRMEDVLVRSFTGDEEKDYERHK